MSIQTSQPMQVDPLPIGSGGANRATTQQMNDNNTTLTLMMAQAKANTVYDPPAPKPITPQLVQPFCGSPHTSHATLAEWIAAAGVAAIAYGILADK
jgi:hypothetical protein